MNVLSAKSRDRKNQVKEYLRDETSLAQELNIMPLLATSADFREAAAAFREKRTPRFTGR